MSEGVLCVKESIDSNPDVSAYLDGELKKIKELEKKPLVEDPREPKTNFGDDEGVEFDFFQKMKDIKRDSVGAIAADNKNGSGRTLNIGMDDDDDDDDNEGTIQLGDSEAQGSGELDKGMYMGNDEDVDYEQDSSEAGSKKEDFSYYDSNRSKDQDDDDVQRDDSDDDMFNDREVGADLTLKDLT